MLRKYLFIHCHEQTIFSSCICVFPVVFSQLFAQWRSIRSGVAVGGCVVMEIHPAGNRFPPVLPMSESEPRFIEKMCEGMPSRGLYQVVVLQTAQRVIPTVLILLEVMACVCSVQLQRFLLVLCSLLFAFLTQNPVMLNMETITVIIM